MTVSAHDVAAVLRERLPDLGVTKVHKLLYYCQGHHLAWFAAPLFHETISAWDSGPVVGTLWHVEKYRTEPPPEGHARLGEAELNTIGYVLSRYGNLTAQDLITLTHGEAPWRTANAVRRPRERVTIEHDWMREFFSTTGAPGDEDQEPVLDSAVVTQWLAGARERLSEPALQADSREAILARLADGA